MLQRTISYREPFVIIFMVTFHIYCNQNLKDGYGGYVSPYLEMRVHLFTTASLTATPLHTQEVGN